MVRYVLAFYFDAIGDTLLTDAQVKTLFTTHFAAVEWSKWQKNYEQFLFWVRDANDEELRRPESQERLWKARAITPVGPGEAINVTGAYTDPEVVDAIIGLRRRDWPPDPATRAEAIQEVGERLLALVRSRHSKVQPRAKLWRLLAALLPSEFHCVFAYEAHAHTAKLLLGPDAAPSHVLIRARLREVLGPEPVGDLAEHVRRSTFCWWLHEQYEALSRGTAPSSTATIAEDRAASVLVLWPYGKQFKGNGAPKNALEVYRRIIQEALPGFSRPELVELLAQTQELSAYKPTALRVMVARVIGLGLMAVEGEVVRPTPAGHALLESDVPDSLVEKMIERVFPFAGLLRHLKGGEPQTPSQINTHLQTLYPNWKETMGPSQLMMWARVLDLAERLPDKRFALSPYGRAWEERLPMVLPEAPLGAAPVDAVPSLEVDGDEEPGPSSESIPWPTFEQMRGLFASDPKARSFVLAEQQLRALHYAWHCNPQRRFVLLAGLSGTGKTAVVRHYSRLYCNALKIEVDQHVAVVPVSPDWRDPTGLLGYLNALHAEPTFQAEPALRLLLRAVRNPHLPYFLVLDEMNLARVELYFAPFLSAMEQEDGRMHLHGDEESINDVPPFISWPRNLFIAGTVNMDETTHPFSDKVLDRAFTLEFWRVDLANFFKEQTLRNELVEQTLTALNEALAPNRRHFGYRTAGEVLSFVATAGGDVPAEVQVQLLDQAVFSKVLPRIRGEQTPELEAMLQAVQRVCEANALSQSRAKLVQMQSALRSTGLTKFWS